RGLQARPDVVLRHLEGEQRVANDILDRLALLPGEAQQCPVVLRAEQHETARPGHRLDLGPCSHSVSTCSECLIHVRLEAPQLPLEGRGHVPEWLVAFESNVVHRDTRIVHPTSSIPLPPSPATHNNPPTYAPHP